jgi:hypothetical protein
MDASTASKSVKDPCAHLKAAYKHQLVVSPKLEFKGLRALTAKAQALRPVTLGSRRRALAVSMWRN